MSVRLVLISAHLTHGAFGVVQHAEQERQLAGEAELLVCLYHVVQRRRPASAPLRRPLWAHVQDAQRDTKVQLCSTAAGAGAAQRLVVLAMYAAGFWIVTVSVKDAEYGSEDRGEGIWHLSSGIKLRTCHSGFV